MDKGLKGILIKVMAVGFTVVSLGACTSYDSEVIRSPLIGEDEPNRRVMEGESELLSPIVNEDAEPEPVTYAWEILENDSWERVSEEKTYLFNGKKDKKIGEHKVRFYATNSSGGHPLEYTMDLHGVYRYGITLWGEGPNGTEILFKPDTLDKPIIRDAYSGKNGSDRLANNLVDAVSVEDTTYWLSNSGPDFLEYTEPHNFKKMGLVNGLPADTKLNGMAVLDEDKAYLATDAGVYVMNLQTREVGKLIVNTEGALDVIVKNKILYAVLPNKVLHINTTEDIVYEDDSILDLPQKLAGEDDQPVPGKIISAKGSSKKNAWAVYVPESAPQEALLLMVDLPMLHKEVKTWANLSEIDGFTTAEEVVIVENEVGSVFVGLGNKVYYPETQGEEFKMVEWFSLPEAGAVITAMKYDKNMKIMFLAAKKGGGTVYYEIGQKDESESLVREVLYSKAISGVTIKGIELRQ
ncbi:hypothetical protein [Fulvitalea axinellae]